MGKLYAGIDIGSLTAEAVIVNQNGIVASASMNVLPNPVDSAQAVLAKILADGNVDRMKIVYTVSTGYGRDTIQQQGMAQENISEISCHGYGAHCLAPAVRTVIDIGGQDAKVIKLNAEGELDDFIMNDKCAAGTGHFLELMCRALGVKLDELAPLSQASRKPVEMSNRCSIFVETEVIHCMQRGLDKADIAAGINRAMAERVLSLVRRVKVEPQVMMTGGVAKNGAVKAELEKMLNLKTLNAKIDPQLIGAFGAAMFARKKGGEA